MLQDPPSKPERSFEIVARRIAAMIQASYRIGQRLPAERDLAKTFGVSRPTVREAILSLAMAGMLKVRSNSGVYVISRQEAPDVHALQGYGPFENLEARQLIEPQIAAIAAQRGTENIFAQLAEALAMMRWEHAQGREADTSDHRFHMVLAEATGNGDCEDYAIANLWLMRSIGYTPEQLQLVVLKDTRTGEYHAVLAVHAEGQNFILDNMSSRVLPDTVLRNYVPIESFSGQQAYIHGFAKAPAPTLTASLQPAE